MVIMPSGKSIANFTSSCATPSTSSWKIGRQMALSCLSSSIWMLFYANILRRSLSIRHHIPFPSSRPSVLCLLEGLNALLHHWPPSFSSSHSGSWRNVWYLTKSKDFLERCVFYDLAFNLALKCVHVSAFQSLNQNLTSLLKKFVILCFRLVLNYLQTLRSLLQALQGLYPSWLSRD